VKVALSRGERVSVGFCYAVVVLACVATLYPFVYVLSASVSDADAILANRVFLWPVGFSLRSYVEIVDYPYLWRSFANTLYVTVAGTAVNLLVTILAAYPLSKERLPGRGLIMFLISFTMWFSGGLIPLYMVFKFLDLTNKLTALVIGFAANSFYIILLRTFFKSIPPGLEDSARIDGANDFAILVRIVLPLTLPALATLGLYYAVSRWNGFFWAMVLITEKEKRPLQVLLREMIIQAKFENEIESVLQDSRSRLVPENIKYAAITVGTVPILCAYPFIQRYFVKGVMVGGIKG
jgi:putative aldouronate transport system permease protein